MSSKSRSAPLSSLNAAEFCRACAQFATGVAIVTVLDDLGQPHGMTVNSFTSVSLDPLIFLVCVDHRAGVRRLFDTHVPMAVNILSEDQRALSVRFARPGEDRFDGQLWIPGTTGAPILPGVLATLEGPIREMIVAGDHTILLIDVHSVSSRTGRPLLYFNSQYGSLGEES
jgi:flavin reductase (DIM6/NTAB) family NADH-FMN oxidoreductase RutF